MNGNLATRPSAPTARPRSSDLVVVVVGDGRIPGWVDALCGASGRKARTWTVPETVGGDGPTCSERVRTIADFATAAARVDTSVLVLLHDGQRAGSGRARVVAGVKRLPEDAVVVTDAVESAKWIDADLVLVHGVPESFGERSVGLPAAVEHGAVVLDTAGHTAGADRDAGVEQRLIRARPHELFGEQLDADLLVVGGARAAGARLGLVAMSALHHAPCALLLVPRFG